MPSLVVGADSYVGARLLSKLGCDGTSRRTGAAHAHLDLLDPDFTFINQYDLVYLCAAANGAKACEGNQESYRVNVDAPVEIARRLNGFMVWIGSQSIEWMDGAYQRQKRAAENILRTMDNVAVVRAGRVVSDNVDSLCAHLIERGLSRNAGVTLWGDDDRTYEH